SSRICLRMRGFTGTLRSIMSCANATILSRTSPAGAVCSARIATTSVAHSTDGPSVGPCASSHAPLVSSSGPATADTTSAFATSGRLIGPRSPMVSSSLQRLQESAHLGPVLGELGKFLPIDPVPALGERGDDLLGVGIGVWPLLAGHPG